MAGKENVDSDLRDFQPPPKKAKTTREPVARFKCPTSNEEMAVLSKGFVPANTQKNNAWAMRVFSEWRVQRNGGISDNVQRISSKLNF